MCSAFPSAPVKSVTRFCYALVRDLFCVFCLTNSEFVQCYSRGSHKVCCKLVLYFALFSNFCFAFFDFFASQTSGLCSGFPSAPVKSVTRFCYALVSVFCLTNTGFVQRYSLGSRKVCCTLVFNFAFFSDFCFACFASQTSLFVQWYSLGSRNFLLCVFYLTNSSLCSAFPFGSPQVYTLLVSLFYSVCV